PVTLAGVNSSGMEWGVGSEWTARGCADTIRFGCDAPLTGRGPDGTYPTLTEAAELAAWGFNTVRLPISWANLEEMAPTVSANGAPVHRYNTDYLKSLYTVVNQLTGQGLAVILSMHQVDWSPWFERGPGAPQLVDPNEMQIDLGGGLMHGLGMPKWLY